MSRHGKEKVRVGWIRAFFGLRKMSLCPDLMVFAWMECWQSVRDCARAFFLKHAFQGARVV